MNRTGLIIALAIAAHRGPRVRPLSGARPQARGAVLRNGANAVHLGLLSGGSARCARAAMWLVAGLAAPPLVALASSCTAAQTAAGARAAPSCSWSAHAGARGRHSSSTSGLKDHWSRSRPIDVPQFGGEERFTAWWDPRGGCPKNCSFVTGDGSGAFWTLAPAALAPPAWRPVAYAAALAFGRTSACSAWRSAGISSATWCSPA